MNPEAREIEKEAAQRRAAENTIKAKRRADAERKRIARDRALVDKYEAEKRAWLAAQAPHRAAWLEATQQGEEVKRSQGQRADLFFDIPTDPRWWSEELWRTRRPGTAGRQLFFELDPAFVDIIDAAPLLEVLERVVGPDVECTGVQARSVPPAPHAGQAYTR